jgi:hypothetical protein
VLKVYFLYLGSLEPIITAKKHYNKKLIKSRFTYNKNPPSSSARPADFSIQILFTLTLILALSLSHFNHSVLNCQPFLGFFRMSFDRITDASSSFSHIKMFLLL